MMAVKLMPTVLIVDDEQQSNLLISEHLAKSGFGTSIAIDGFKALAACKVRLPDVILLSPRIPLLSAKDIVSRLLHGRNHGRRCHQ
jgi:DNA-binding response OmpR family regulator